MCKEIKTRREGSSYQQTLLCNTSFDKYICVCVCVCLCIYWDFVLTQLASFPMYSSPRVMAELHSTQAFPNRIWRFNPMQQISACQQDYRVQSALAPVKGESIYDLIIGVLVSAIHLYFRIWSCCQSLIAFTAQINMLN